MLVGKGEHTHVYNPDKHSVLCNSGKNAGRRRRDGSPTQRGAPQQLFKSKANFLTCYRCEKLATRNVREGRKPWQGPKD